MSAPTLEEIEARQKEATHKWVLAQSAALAARHGPPEPPKPKPPKPPTADASAREHFDFWRMNQGRVGVVDHLALTLAKILDRLDKLEERLSS